MLYEKIDEMIASAMKNHETKRLSTYKLIKSELSKAYHNGTEMSEENEVKILMKMAAQREDSIEQYTKGNREDLANEEKEELQILNAFIPKQPTEEEVIECTEGIIAEYVDSMDNDYVLSMKDMKPILQKVLRIYPSASGKIISQVLKNKLK